MSNKHASSVTLHVRPDTSMLSPAGRALIHAAEHMLSEQEYEPLNDHEPRCDCGHLFEICNYPNCPLGGDACQ